MRKGPWNVEVDFSDTYGWQVVGIEHKELGDMDLIDEDEAPLSKVAFDAMVQLQEGRFDRKKDATEAVRAWLALAVQPSPSQTSNKD